MKATGQVPSTKASALYKHNNTTIYFIFLIHCLAHLPFDNCIYTPQHFYYTYGSCGFCCGCGCGCGCGYCERSVGTVFQLPSPDAIYSRDEEKERKVGRHLMFVFAHGPRAAEAR
jgi:hypothetical protein